MRHHIVQKAHLRRRQRKRPPVRAENPLAMRVAQIPAAEIRRFRRRLRILFKPHPPQQRVHLRRQQQRLERLRDVVVAAQREPIVVIAVAILRRQQDHRYRRDRPQRAQHRQPVRSRHHNIQEHQLARLRSKRRQQRIARRKRAHLVPLAFEKSRHNIAQRLLVVRVVDHSHFIPS